MRNLEPYTRPIRVSLIRADNIHDMGTLKIERVSLMQVIESWNVSLPLQGFNCGQAILMFLSHTKDSDQV